MFTVARGGGPAEMPFDHGIGISLPKPSDAQAKSARDGDDADFPLAADGTLPGRNGINARLLWYNPEKSLGPRTRMQPLNDRALVGQRHQRNPIGYRCPDYYCWAGFSWRNEVHS